jgi:hypothetical protein
VKVLYAGVVIAMLAACASGSGVPATPPGQGPIVPSLGQFSVLATASAAPSLALPTGGGYGGTLTLGGNIALYAQVTQTLQNTLPPSLPSLGAMRTAAAATRGKLDIGSGQALVYFGVNFDQRMPSFGTFTPPATFPPATPTDPPPAPVSLSLTIPSAVQVNGTYYLAFYDPLRPSLGWQLGFEGPAAPGATLKFGGNAATFVAYQQYWFAVYVVPTSANPPSAAPTISPVPTPIPTAVTLTNLQNQMGLATTCTGTPCASGKLPTPQPSATFSIATGVKSPSLSGSSTQLSVTANPFHGDVLFFMPGQPFLSPLATSFTWDFFFAIDQPLVDNVGRPVGPVEALEFDVNVNLPGFAYNFSSQCVIQPGDVWQWQIWGFDGNGSEQNWINAGIPCNPALFTVLPVWHHVVWTYAIDPNLQKKQYLMLSFDGNLLTPGQVAAVGQAEPRSGQATVLESQFQIDVRPIPTNAPTFSPVFNEWVDNVTLTYK